MNPQEVEKLFAALPKAELHLHLEGAIEPATVAELAARYGVALTPEEAAERYTYSDFTGFLEAFKWVTSLLRAPADYRLVAERLADRLISQRVVYAEVTLSVGVMLRRKQDAEANVAAICEVAAQARVKGLRLSWIFDAVRQFGPRAAMEVARCAARMKSGGVVAFGMGGDELSVPAAEFRAVYDSAAREGLHRVAHAGETGGAEAVRDAIELLGAERIGHGIAVMRDEQSMDFLAARRIPLEICVTSNLRTGALARQLGRAEAEAQDHPLPDFLRRGLCVTLSTDDPAMFHTDLVAEYGQALRLGLQPGELARIAEMSFEFAFLPPEEKQPLLEAFRAQRNSQGLL